MDKSTTNKVMYYTSEQKLLDGLITILARTHTLVEANKRVRPDRSLQWTGGEGGLLASGCMDTMDITSQQISRKQLAESWTTTTKLRQVMFKDVPAPKSCLELVERRWKR